MKPNEVIKCLFDHISDSLKPTIVGTLYRKVCDEIGVEGYLIEFTQSTQDRFNVTFLSQTKVYDYQQVLNNSEAFVIHVNKWCDKLKQAFDQEAVEIPIEQPVSDEDLIQQLSYITDESVVATLFEHNFGEFKSFMTRNNNRYKLDHETYEFLSDIYRSPFTPSWSELS